MADLDDGTVLVQEKSGGSDINVLTRKNDPQILATELELNKKKNDLAGLGFSIREFSKADFKDGIGFSATKQIASDTVRKLSFAVKKKE